MAGKSRVFVHADRWPGIVRIQPSVAIAPRRSGRECPAQRNSARPHADPAKNASCRTPIHHGDLPASTESARSFSSMRGMSMRTGQTSLHAPHKLLACGSS